MRKARGTLAPPSHRETPSLLGTSCAKHSLNKEREGFFWKAPVFGATQPRHKTNPRWLPSPGLVGAGTRVGMGSEKHLQTRTQPGGSGDSVRLLLGRLVGGSASDAQADAQPSAPTACQSGSSEPGLALQGGREFTTPLASTGFFSCNNSGSFSDRVWNGEARRLRFQKPTTKPSLSGRRGQRASASGSTSAPAPAFSRHSLCSRLGTDFGFSIQHHCTGTAQ